MSELKPLPSYITGAWTLPATSTALFEAINPATEEVCARVALCGADDVDRAMAAARAAFDGYASTNLEDRLALVEKLIAIFEARYDEMVTAISTEMGAPYDLSYNAQAECGPGHLKETVKAAREMVWERPLGGRGRQVHEAVGVCALITPWNWPINQLAAKIGPALVAGCTMVLKPSEIAPLSGYLFAEILHEAGVPAGVFNLVNGDGPGVGAPLSAHPGIDMVSFTGSTRAGVLIAKAAADSVKRVSQELGGKSPNIILDHAGFADAVFAGARACFYNTGQSCNAPTRMLVPAARHAEALEAAARAAATEVVGGQFVEGTTVGPVVSDVQWRKIQGLIEKGIAEGAQLVAGGPGLPDGITKGYFVKPTVFGGVNNQMTIAREEIFGPVLSIIPYDSVDQAVEIANDTPYGLSSYISGDLAEAKQLATRLRTGMVHLNGASTDIRAPFGGFKQSGNGREWGEWGFHDFLEIKAMMGYGA
jgi:aldehyde dehydrogenase (NAD+)